jgi:hypothetical protein
MSDTNYYAFEQPVPITPEIYGKIRERLGSEPLDGQIVHLVLRSPEGSLRYIDVWTSKEACDRAIRERIHPAVHAVFAEENFRPNGEPKRLPIDVIDVMIGK